MQGLKDELAFHAIVAVYLYYQLKFIAKGFLWDIGVLARVVYCAAPEGDPNRFIGPQRLEWAIWRGMQWTGDTWTRIQWRHGDSVWAGIKALWQWYWAMIRMQREMKSLEVKLRPLMAEYGTPGQTVGDFVESLPKRLKLADVGEAIKNQAV
jgi:hypothetical protein